MAETAEAFPTLPAKQWWALRDRFKRSMPPQVTPNYVESALAVNGSTAKDIVLQLRHLRLVDTDNRPTEIAEDWRHDDTYANACGAIRNAVYPEELLHAAPDPNQDRSGAERWFARRKKVGQNAALKMAIMYQLVTAADLTKAPDQSKQASKAKTGGQPSIRPSRSAATGVRKHRPGSTLASAKGEQRASDTPPVHTTRLPALHIDVQIHISPEASPEQIERIFASMGKHLYKSGGGSDAE